MMKTLSETCGIRSIADALDLPYEKVVEVHEEVIGPFTGRISAQDAKAILRKTCKYVYHEYSHADMFMSFKNQHPKGKFVVNLVPMDGPEFTHAAAMVDGSLTPQHGKQYDMWDVVSSFEIKE